MLRANAHRLPDRFHVVSNVLPVDFGSARRRLQQASKYRAKNFKNKKFNFQEPANSTFSTNCGNLESYAYIVVVFPAPLCPKKAVI